MFRFLNKYPKKCLLLFATALFFIGCKKNIDNVATTNNPNQVIPPANTAPDLTTTVHAAVSGFVIDENNAYVQGAAVHFGNATTKTDYYGYFEIKNVAVVKTAAVVAVTKEGYFKSVKTFAAETGKAGFFRIKLIPKDYMGSIDAASGGNYNFSNGASIALPANAVVTVPGNTPYTGNVIVSAYFIDPLATDLSQIIPGDLRGIDNNGSIKGLTTFGMLAVELTSTSGELLQIASGKKATLQFPMAPSLAAAAPASIPLWYFDESNGLWKEEGTATKTGNVYTGDVSHFSTWNCDVPNAIVPLTFTMVNDAAVPIANAYIDIVPHSGPGAYIQHVYGTTDASGYVSVFLTANTQYELAVYNNCNAGGGTPAYSQNISSGSQPVSLGNVVLTAAAAATVSGTVTDCNNNPVSNGFVVIQYGGNYYQHCNLDANGAYHFSTVLCSPATNITVTAHDVSNAKESSREPHVLVPGNNVVGNTQACAVSSTEFYKFSIDGAPDVTYTMPADSIFRGTSGNWTIIGAYTPPNFAASLSEFNIMETQGYYFVTTWESPVFNGGPANPELIHITEFGNIGDFMAGNWSAVIGSNTSPSVPHNVTCSFRLRRMF